MASTTPPNPGKKRKIDRACDACRKRKTKCDGPWKPDKICSNCLHSGKSCTYVESSKPRGPPKSFILELEDKMEAMEAFLQQRYPGIDFEDQLGPRVVRDSWKDDESSTKYHHQRSTHDSSRPTPVESVVDPHRRPKTVDFDAPLSLLPAPSLGPPITTERKHGREIRGPTPAGSESSSISGDELVSSSDSEQIEESTARPLTLRSTDDDVIFLADDPGSGRFHGRGSMTGFVDDTRKMKELYLEQSKTHGEYPKIGLHRPDRREQFWRAPNWELNWEGYNSDAENFLSYMLARFPPPDLADSLINGFFDQFNTYYPIIHRLTFERQYYSVQLQRNDFWFAALCHTIFAVTSKWSKDPRVVPSNARTPGGDLDWQKAGSDYFNLAMDCHRIRRSLILPVALFELQTLPLLAMFLRSTSSYPVGWLLVSIGLRKAQDVGAHRKKMYRTTSNAEGELWRRTFWFLLWLDTLGSTALGRPTCICQEDYDVDLPLDVDDEYWDPDAPAQQFKQPTGVPCRVSSFIHTLRIIPILHFALRTVYAIDKSASFVPKSRSELERLLKELEDALRKWYAAVPKHLDMTNPVFPTHATMLHFMYCFVQIVIYRPFVVLPFIGKARAGRDAISRSAARRAMKAATAAAGDIVRSVESQLAFRAVSLTSALLSSYYAGCQLVLGLWDLKVREKAQNEKKGVYQDLGTSLPTDGDADEDEDETGPPLAQQIGQVTADLRKLVGIYQNQQGRWEFMVPVLGKLQEFLPTDGETRVAELDASCPPLGSPFFGPGPSQGMQGESSTGLTGFEYFANQSQPQDPSIFSFYSPLDVNQNFFANPPPGPAAQAQQPSDYCVPTSQPAGEYQGPPFHDPTSAGPNVYNHGVMQPLFEPSQLRHSQTYSVSVPGPDALSNFDPQPPSGLQHHQEWYGSAPSSITTGEAPYYQDPQYALVGTGIPTTTHPQAQQRQTGWINQPVSSHDPPQQFGTLHEPPAFANTSYQSASYSNDNVRDNANSFQTW